MFKSSRLSSSLLSPSPAVSTMRARLARFRLPLVAAGIFVLTLALTGGHALAQTPGVIPAPEEKPMPSTVSGLILSQWKDPIFLTIGGLSIWGLTLIIQGFIKNRASVLMPEETTNQIRDMISQRKFKELIEFTETDDSFISKALNPALKRAPSFSSMKEAMETSLGEITADQFRKIEPLNIIGNIGPLLGLMGTVLGMINAFLGMSNSGGKTNPGVLAGGISQALTHTFLGLFLALPCLVAFGFLRTMVDRLTMTGALTSEELLLMIKPAEAKPAAAGAVAGPGAPRAAATPQPAVRKAPPMPVPTPQA